MTGALVVPGEENFKNEKVVNAEKRTNKIRTKVSFQCSNAEVSSDIDIVRAASLV